MPSLPESSEGAGSSVTTEPAQSLQQLTFGAGNAPVGEIGSNGSVGLAVRLDVGLEDLGDSYPALRSIWHNVGNGGTLTVRYGSKSSPFQLDNDDVRLLLRLNSFEPATVTKTQFGREMVAAKGPRNTRDLACTVIVPCRNEVDNVANLVNRLPAIGKHTELIFVDGNSSDGTPERIDQLIAENPDRDIKLLRQAGNTGKAGASFQGFEAASCDTAMILDADMTVRPEDLPRFHDALADGVASFANGTRLMYPMAHGAMPGLNTVGNHVFSRYMSWLVGARITDTLCGTKAFFRKDFDEILRVRPLFGGHDPWGDFDLIMGAAYAGLTTTDVPIRYEAREAGESKMRPVEHGWALAQTCLMGARRLKLGRRAS